MQTISDTGVRTDAPSVLEGAHAAVGQPLEITLEAVDHVAGGFRDADLIIVLGAAGPDGSDGRVTVSPDGC